MAPPPNWGRGKPRETVEEQEVRPFAARCHSLFRGLSAVECRKRGVEARESGRVREDTGVVCLGRGMPGRLVNELSRRTAHQKPSVAPLSGRPTEEERLEPFLADDPSQLPEGEERNQRDDLQWNTGEKFVPVRAGELELVRDRPVVNDRSEQAFEDRERSDEKAEHQRLPEGGDDEGSILESLTEMEQLPDEDDLAEDERLEERPPVLEVVDLVRGEDESSIGGERREEEEEEDNHDEVPLHLVDQSLPDSGLRVRGLTRHGRRLPRRLTRVRMQACRDFPEDQCNGCWNSHYPARGGRLPPAPAVTARTPRGSYFFRTWSSRWRV